MCIFNIFKRKKDIPIQPLNNITEALLAVPYKRAIGENWCLPASAQMILAYYKENIAQSIIASRVVINRKPSTFRLLSYAKELGYDAEWRPKTIAEIEEYLRQGIPLIVIQKYSNTLPYEHSRVIFGFDSVKQELTLHDPSGKNNYKISYKVFFNLGFNTSKSSQIVILRK